MKRGLAVAGVVTSLALTGCTSEADTVSRNLSQGADNFEVQRRVVFYNSISDTVMLEIIGLCSLGNTDSDSQKTVTCKTGPDEYKKHYLGLSDNVTYYAEQIDGVEADPFYYRLNFRPQAIIPDIDLQTTDALPPTQP